jgi:hypothetical protein
MVVRVDKIVTIIEGGVSLDDTVFSVSSGTEVWDTTMEAGGVMVATLVDFSTASDVLAAIPEVRVLDAETFAV